MKKLLFTGLLALGSLISPLYGGGTEGSITDVYDLRMSVKVPRIYNNTESLGYRKYQAQRIVGELWLVYKDNHTRPTILVTNLVNKTHKMSNGRYVSYRVNVDNEGTQVYPRINLIGNNKTDVFKTPSVIFYLDAEPSYNLGDDTEDNSLLVTLAGTGSTSTSIEKGNRVISKLTGNLAGTLGCGCTAYGHISPTRVAGPYLYLVNDYTFATILPSAFWSHYVSYWSCISKSPDNYNVPIIDDVAAVWGTWSAKYNKSKSRR